MAFILDPNNAPPAPGQPQQGQGPAPARPQPGAPAPRPGLVGGDAVGTAGPLPHPAAGEVVKDSNTEMFMTDVIDASMQVPVIVDFWATWCGPCKTLGPILEKVVRQAGGMVRLVKIDVDQNQQLAAQLRIQSIPAVYAFKDGRPIDGFSGALPESQVRAFVERLLGDAKPPLEEAATQAAALLEAGQHEEAGDLYNQILAQEPGYPPAIAGLIRVAMATGDKETARGLIDGIEPALKKDPAVAAAITAVELAEEAGSHAGEDLAPLRKKLADNPKDHQVRFDLAMALLGQNQQEGAIDELLELIRRDRNWNEEAGRKQLIKIFEALGPTHALTVASRKRLSSILFS
jgi:putative thioredoxin